MTRYFQLLSLSDLFSNKGNSFDFSIGHCVIGFQSGKRCQIPPESAGIRTVLLDFYRAMSGNPSWFDFWIYCKLWGTLQWSNFSLINCQSSPHVTGEKFVPLSVHWKSGVKLWSKLAGSVTFWLQCWKPFLSILQNRKICFRLCKCVVLSFDNLQFGHQNNGYKVKKANKSAKYQLFV